MASDVDTYVREILDNVQVIEATRKLATEEKVLAKVREASGTAGVKAYKQVTAEAAKAAKEAERAAKGPSAWTQALTANTEAVKDSVKELGEFRSKVNLGAESLGKIGAALSLVDPSLASVAQGLQKVTGLASAGAAGSQVLGGAMTSVATAAVGVGLAVAPLITLYADLASAQEQAKASEEARANAMNRNIGFTERVAKAQRAALDAVKGDEERERIKITEAWTAALEEELAPLREEYALLEKISGNSPKAVEARKRMNELVEEQIELEAKASLGADADILAADIARDRAEAEQSVTDRLKDKEKAIKDVQKADEDAFKEAMAYLQKEIEAEHKFNENLGQSQADRAKKEQDELDAFNDMLKEKGEADAEALAESEERYAESIEKRRAMAEDMLSGVSDLTAGVFDLITQSQEQATDRATDRVETLQEAYDEAVADGDTAKAKALKAQVRAAEKGALDAFEAQQKTALAQAIVQGILGVATAAASAPPPANLIPMGVAALTGAAQVAAVKAVKPPEFDDTPEAMMARNMQPARAQVSLHRDDIFIAGKTPESVVNQAAGLAGGGSSWRRSFGPKLAQGTLTLLTRDVQRAARGRIRG